MSSNINPSLKPTSTIADFKFWCQKVLPTVYDDSLSYYEVLGKMVIKINEMVETVNNDADNVITLRDAFLALQDYVNNFFEDIDQLVTYAERAEAAQTAANTSAINAATSASNASESSLAAMDARDTAVAARQAAQASANNASTAATNATTKANQAAQSAITAQTAQASASQSATLAATDRSAAQTAASTATTKANEANASATNAAESATNAEQSKDDAEALVNNVQESLDNIQQNTQDIAELKELTNNYPTPWLEDYLNIFTIIHEDTSIAVRKAMQNRNVLKIEDSRDSSGTLTYFLTGSEFTKGVGTLAQVTVPETALIDVPALLTNGYNYTPYIACFVRNILSPQSVALGVTTVKDGTVSKHNLELNQLNTFRPIFNIAPELSTADKFAISLSVTRYVANANVTIVVALTPFPKIDTAALALALENS